MSKHQQLLPIKVVLSQPRDYKPYHKPSGGPKPLCRVTRKMRERFAEQVRQVQQHFSQKFQSDPETPAVAKLKLKSEAVAKSHRPRFLFNEETCPIIGGDKFGELYVSVRPDGLRRLEDQIRTDPRKRAIANISTIVSITPYTKTDAISESLTAAKKNPVTASKKQPVRVRLFRYPNAAVNAAIDKKFEDEAAAHGINDIRPIDYADGLKVYKISGLSPEEALAGKEWRLMFDTHMRSGTAPIEQDVILIITIRDPEQRAPVYNELVRRMAIHGWEAQNLKLRHRFRSKG